MVDLDLVPRTGTGTGTLVVSEIFGPTIQGEGPATGQWCLFVRLGGCNLHCSWCDTPYTWDWTGRNGVRYTPDSLVRMAPDAVYHRLRELAGTVPRMVVVSGGEPMLQAGALVPLLTRLHADGTRIHIETNGTVVPPRTFPYDLIDHYSVSLKLPSSGNVGDRTLDDRAILWYRSTGRAIWKFVATSPADLDAIQAVADRYTLDPIWVMPEGTDRATILKGMEQLVQPVIDRGWNLTTRLHVLLWGNERER